MNLPNLLTALRIILSPFFMFFFFLPMWAGQRFTALSIIVCILLFIVIEFSDLFDGIAARKCGQVTDFGKIFDPFADVILHLTTFVCFIKSYNPEISYTPIAVLLFIMLREFSQNFLRMVAAKKGVAIAARKGGKFKTVMYIVSEFYALLLETFIRTDNIPACFNTLKIISVVLFIICVICSYASFIDYLVHFGKVLKDN